MKQPATFRLFVFAALLLLAHVASAQPASALDDARAALNAKDLAKAELLLVPLTGADSTDAAAFQLFCQVRLGQKKTKEAIALAERATQLDATNAEYFAQLGLALGQRMGELGFMQQAMLSGKLKKAFEKTVELDPRNLNGLIGLARWYAAAPEIAGGSLEKAREFALRVQQLDSFRGELELGNVSGRDEKYADALAHYEAAAKLKPDSAGAQNMCGRMLVKLERKEEARACFVAALKLNPDLESAKKALAELDGPAK